MNRLHVPKAEIAPTVVVRGDRAGYLRDVLRLKPGAPIEVFDGEGMIYAAKLEQWVGDDAELTLGEGVARPFTGATITLLQGLPKADKLELVIQKAVELGVRRVVPVACERSIVKLDAKKAVERVQRWQKIADEASRQCKRADVAEIGDVVALDKLLAAAPLAGERRLLLDEEETALRMRDALGSPAAHWVLLVGPEGGFTREEVAAAKRAGFQTVTLGPRILRTETAGLAAISIVQHVLGDLG